MFNLTKDHVLTLAAEIAKQQIDIGILDRAASGIFENGNDLIVQLTVRYSPTDFDPMSLTNAPDTIRRFQVSLELGSVSVCELPSK